MFFYISIENVLNNNGKAFFTNLKCTCFLYITIVTFFINPLMPGKRRNVKKLNFLGLL